MNKTKDIVINLVTSAVMIPVILLAPPIYFSVKLVDYLEADTTISHETVSKAIIVLGVGVVPMQCLYMFLIVSVLSIIF
jgi:hypothetical protein